MIELPAPTVLVVNDQTQPLAAIEMLLEASGYHVLTARDGRAGLEAARRHRPDLVISDARLPRLDAWEMCRAIREDASLRSTAVLVANARHEDAASMADGVAAAADGYLPLPCEPMRVLAAAAHHIERRRVGAALLETDARYRLVTETATDAIITIDERGLIVFVNPATERLFGLTAAELLGESVTVLMPQALRAAHVDGLRRYLDTGRRAVNWASIEVIGLHRSGREIPLELSFGECQATVGRQFTAIARDISERKRAAEEAAHGADFSRALTSSLGEGVYALDAEGRVTFMNPAAERMLGWSQAELLGRDMHDTIHFQRADGSPTSRQSCRLLSVLRSGETVTVDSDVYTRKDGTTFQVAYNSAPIVSDGAVIGAVLAFRDITEQQRAADELRRTEQRYRDLVENARDVIYTIDLDGNLTSVNRIATEITGYTVDEMCGMNLAQLVAPDDIERVRREIAEVLAGIGTTHYEAVIIAKDGRRVAMEVSCRLVEHDGVPLGVHGVARDVTARKELEASFQHAQKMEAVGRLAGGIAHDFNNVLTTIIGFSTFILEQLPHGDPLRRDLVEINRAGERGAALTRQLLAFTRRQVLMPRVVDLNVVIDEMGAMLRRLLGETVELVTVLPASPAMVKADRGQLEQVVMNLAVNARDAMPHGGRLTVETLVTADEVVVTVRDTGTGMDEPTRRRIFEPFYTTKAAGRGTGLGLSTVYGIVEQSGGKISVDTAPGRGAAFRINLPRTFEPATAPAPRAAAPAAAGGATILLVEDDPAVRRITKAVLTRSGYYVIEASDAETALRLAGADLRIDVVVTDMVLPGTNGRVLAESLVALRPGLGVVYMSGYADDAALNGIGSAPGLFLPKPFSRDALLGAVDRLLRRDAEERPTPA